MKSLKVTIKPKVDKSPVVIGGEEYPAQLYSTDHEITVGDWTLGRGVIDFNLSMPAGGKPTATITFYPESVDIDAMVAGVQASVLNVPEFDV
ncbi:hypothetical protein MKL26_04595 [Streptococcus suis]|nr:hypothetical protein [Streptococcus suis]